MNKRKKCVIALITSVFMQIPIVVYAKDGISNGVQGEKYEKKTITISNEDGEELFKSSFDGEVVDPGNPNRILNDNEKQMIAESETEKQSYEVLVPKTNANYEVALSYTNGDYTYVDKADTYNDAVSIAKEKESQLAGSSDIIVPIVIDNQGNTLFATECIARAYKMYQAGNYDANNKRRSRVCNIFSDSGLNNIYTYINDDYLSEMPLIQNNENEALVLLNGYKGWMNKNINRNPSNENGLNSSDIRIQPITDVTNPSYYIVHDGVLYHRASTSMDGTSSTGEMPIGVAPSYLQSDKRYFSYDGNYFYETTAGDTSAASALRKLTHDLQNGNYNQAINANNPYYNYYNCLPFRSKTNYTADELNRYIANNTKSNSALRGLGQAFIDAQNNYGVNALLALGISMNESGGGTSDYALNRKNLFGLNATDDNTNLNASYFSSYEACINYFARNFISLGYANPRSGTYYGGFLGNKALGANVKYASDPYWADKAAEHAFNIDYYLSGDNINNMKDYDYYQLVRFTGVGTVTDENNNSLYDVNCKPSPGRAGSIGNISIINGINEINKNGILYEKIVPDRPMSMSSDFEGEYDWNVSGYFNKSLLQLINEGKTNKYNENENEDLNGDKAIDAVDLALEGTKYNFTSSVNGWNSRYDINKDAIIDIYDIVSICKYLN